MAVTIDGTNGITSPDFEPSSSTTPTNGLFLPAANTVGLATGSTERLRIDSSGNLGLGVTPSGWVSPFTNAFQIGTSGAVATTTTSLRFANNAYYGSLGWTYRATAAAGHYDIIDNTHSWYNAPSGTAGNAISFTQAMTLDASGNLGIGTSSPAYKLDVFNSGGTSIAVGASTGKIYLYGDNSGTTVGTISAIPLRFATNSTEQMRIDSSGNLLVGITSNSGVRCYVKGEGSTNGTWSIYATNSSGTTQFGLRNDNYLYAPSVGNYGTTGTTVVVNGNYLGYLSSSIRFKKDIVDYDKGLTEILTLRPVYYKSKNPNPDGQYDEQRYAGLIAEEIADLGFDEFVLNGPDGKINSIQYGNMVALCIKAIQELTARLEALENK